MVALVACKQHVSYASSDALSCQNANMLAENIGPVSVLKGNALNCN